MGEMIEEGEAAAEEEEEERGGGQQGERGGERKTMPAWTSPLVKCDTFIQDEMQVSVHSSVPRYL